jgi:hypothetical protein
MGVQLALYAHLAFFLLIAVPFLLNRRASLFHPLAFYLLFHFIVFVLRPFMVHYLKFDGRWVYMRFFPTDDEFVFTLLVSSVALLIFALSCWFFGRAHVPHIQTMRSLSFPHFNSTERRAYLWTLFLLGPFTLYSMLFASQDVGLDDLGDIQMTQDLATGITIYVNTTGYVVDAQTMFGTLAVLTMWRFRFAWWTWLPIVLFVLYRGFLGGGRWPMITTILTIILISLYRSRKRWFRLRYLVVLLPLFVFFQNIGLNRNYFRDMIDGGQRIVHEVPEERDWLQQQDNPDFANFEFLAYILNVVPERSGTYTYFTQYLQIFTEPIPRILWHEKPIGAPIQLINLNNYGNFVGLTNSLAGDGWLSFGWPGLAITMALVGLFLGWLHRKFWLHASNPRVVVTYCIFVPLTILWFRDGGITIVKTAMFTLLPILIWQGLIRLMTPSGIPHGRVARFHLER